MLGEIVHLMLEVLKIVLISHYQIIAKLEMILVVDVLPVIADIQ